MRRSSKIVVDASNHIPVFEELVNFGSVQYIKKQNKHDDNVRKKSDFFSLFARPKLSKAKTFLSHER